MTEPLLPARKPYPNVVQHADVDAGRPFIENTRVPVSRIYSWHRQGTTVETLLRRYPQLGPARIFAALAFAYDNQELIVADLIREREQLARAQDPSPHPRTEHALRSERRESDDDA